MFIRKILPADAAAVSALTAQLGYNLSPEKTLDQINAIIQSNNDVAFVAVDDDRVVGWIHAFYALRLECHPFCEIGGLIVGASLRGRGAGQMLIDQVMQWSQERNCRTLKVRCNTIRVETHHFYEHLGFIERKEQKLFLKTL